MTYKAFDNTDGGADVLWPTTLQCSWTWDCNWTPSICTHIVQLTCAQSRLAPTIPEKNYCINLRVSA